MAKKKVEQDAPEVTEITVPLKGNKGKFNSRITNTETEYHVTVLANGKQVEIIAGKKVKVSESIISALEGAGFKL